MKFVFADIETTGLGMSCDMLELASIAFADDLHVIDSFNELIIPPGLEREGDVGGPTEESLAARFEPRALEMARSNGLFMDILGLNAKPLNLVRNLYEDWLHKIMVEYSHNDKDIRLCGNNVESFDFRFITRDMPEAAKLFHYRKLNVSSLRMTFANATGMDEEELKKSYGFGKHRALQDCEASFNEWQSYRNVLHAGRHMVNAYHDKEKHL